MVSSLAKQKRKKAPKIPNSRPKPVGGPFNVGPNLFEIQRIKQQATDDAVRILEEKLRKSEEEIKRLQIEAYNDAIADAQKFFTIAGCRALKNKFGFGYKRFEIFLDETMRVMAEEDLNELEKWLAGVGFRLELSDIGDEVKKKGDSNDTH